MALRHVLLIVSLMLVGCKEMKPRPLAMEPTPSPFTPSPSTPSPSTPSATAPTPSATAPTPSATAPTPTHVTATPTLTPGPTSTLETTPSPTDTPLVTASPTHNPSTPKPSLDPDGDGYSALQGDCQPTDPRAYPGAPDLPLDGRDDNCNGIQDQMRTLVGVTLNERSDALLARVEYGLGVAYNGAKEPVFGDHSLFRVRAVDAGGSIRTLSGNGTNAAVEVGQLADTTSIFVNKLAEAPATGRLYIGTDRVIYYLDQGTGSIEHFLGDGTIESANDLPEDGETLETIGYGHLDALAVDPTYGWLYFAVGRGSSFRSSKVYRAQRDGDGVWRVYHVAGLDSCAPLDLSKPATETSLCRVEGIAVSPNGGPVYLSTYNDWEEYYGGPEHSYVLKLEGGAVSVALGDGGHCDGEEPIATEPLALTLCKPGPLALSWQDELFVMQGDGTLLNYDTQTGSVAWVAGEYGWYDPERATWVRSEDFSPYVESGGPFDLPLTGVLDIAAQPYPGTDVLLNDADHGTIRRLSRGAEPSIERVAGLASRGYSDGAPTHVQLDEPAGLAWHTDPQTGEGALFIADSGNYVIRRVAANSVGLFAGVPEVEGAALAAGGALSTPMRRPTALVATAAGVLYFVEDQTRIKRVSGGFTSVVAGLSTPGFSGDGGPSTQAAFDGISSIAWNEAGSTLYVADRNNHRVRRIVFNAAGVGVVDTLIGTGAVGALVDGAQGLETPLGEVWDLAFDSGGLYLGLQGPDAIARWSEANGTLAVLAAEAGSYSAELPELGRTPFELAIDRHGYVYLEGAEPGTVQRLGAEGVVTVVGQAGNHIYNLDFGTVDQIGLSGVSDLAVGGDGNLYIADGTLDVVRVITW